jgi:hypothetical protein
MLGVRQVGSGEVAPGEDHAFGAQPAQVLVAELLAVELAIGLPGIHPLSRSARAG